MKKIYVLIGIIAIILVVGIVIFLNKDLLKKDAPKKETEPFTISLENSKCDSKEKIIYTFPDGKKVYSNCGEIYYTNSKEKKIPLSEALKQELLTIKDISDKMDYLMGLYDGGTIVYQYKDKDNNLSTDNFKLEVCNQTQGSKDIQFMSIDSEKYMCAIDR